MNYRYGSGRYHAVFLLLRGGCSLFFIGNFPRPCPCIQFLHYQLIGFINQTGHLIGKFAEQLSRLFETFLDRGFNRRKEFIVGSFENAGE